MTEWHCRCCGKCCRHLEVELTLEDRERIPEIFWYPYDGVFLMKQVERGSDKVLDFRCIAQKRNRCSIYTIRPAGCRDYCCIGEWWHEPPKQKGLFD